MQILGLLFYIVGFIISLVVMLKVLTIVAPALVIWYIAGLAFLFCGAVLTLLTQVRN